jgi:hypothetical protein
MLSPSLALSPKLAQPLWPECWPCRVEDRTRWGGLRWLLINLGQARRTFRLGARVLVKLGLVLPGPVDQKGGS